MISVNVPSIFPSDVCSTLLLSADCLLLFSPPGKPVEDTAVFAVEQGTDAMADHETDVTTGVTTEEIVSI